MASGARQSAEVAMSRKLDDLSPQFRPLAILLLARCTEAQIPVLIVNTRRTVEEQAGFLAKGVSWTLHSKHLTGDAIDICPFEIYALHGPDKLRWNPDDSVWLELGKIGRKIGLVWGGDWHQRDLGHFEYPTPVHEELIA